MRSDRRAGSPVSIHGPGPAGRFPRGLHAASTRPPRGAVQRTRAFRCARPCPPAASLHVGIDSTLAPGRQAEVRPREAGTLNPDTFCPSGPVLMVLMVLDRGEDAPY